MADSDDFLDEGGEPAESGGAKKKGGGLGGILPNILKFVAIGLGAMVFIVTVCVITFNIMNKGGKSQTVISNPDSPYIGKRPDYGYYDSIGSMTVRTRDFPVSSTVSITMIIGYEATDQAASQELATRRFELRDFIRRYFAGKTAADLAPDKEEALKAEIREMLNTRFLDSRGARVILFDRLDVTSDI